uniref:Putative 28 kDa metastriate family member n=1 Tax=Rhipicephalus pulchellus TaxID=72859 RepID=L7M993_RHIPC
MLRLSVVVLCFILQQCIVESSLKNGTHTAKIGKGIEVKAYVIYDVDKYRTEYKPTHKKKQGVAWYFLGLFDEVESYFHHHNVMVKFSVIAAEWKEHIWVKRNETLDINATLANVQKAHPSNYSRPNETIVYLFTNKTLPMPWKTDAATIGTFCTPNVSAAIAVQAPGNINCTSTVKATKLVFGASDSTNFTEEDMDNMNKTFSKCYIKTKKRRTTTGKTTATPTTTDMNNTGTN